MIKANSQTDHISAFWDVLPTFCDIAKTKSPKNIDGISFLPAMLGKKQMAHDYLYWEFHERGGKQAIRKGDWKAVKLQVSKIDNPDIELYNLINDPGEQNNIADKHPEIINEMIDIFATARTADPNWPLLAKEK